MLIINKSQVHFDDGKLIAEASTIGLRPGDWPVHISVVDDGGSGFLFQRGDRIDHGGEFGGYRYYSRIGTVLVVFND